MTRKFAISRDLFRESVSFGKVGNNLKAKIYRFDVVIDDKSIHRVSSYDIFENFIIVKTNLPNYSSSLEDLNQKDVLERYLKAKKDVTLENRTLIEKIEKEDDIIVALNLVKKFNNISRTTSIVKKYCSIKNLDWKKKSGKDESDVTFLIGSLKIHSRYNVFSIV